MIYLYPEAFHPKALNGSIAVWQVFWLPEIPAAFPSMEDSGIE